MRVLVWLWKTKISWKSKIVFDGYRRFYCSVKTDYIYKDIAEEVETRFDIWTDHYHKEKIKKVIGLMKDELGWIIIAKLVRLRAKSYSYLLDDGSEDKKSKCTKKYVIKKT